MKTPMGSADTLLLLDIDCMIATIFVHGSCIHRYFYIACLLSLWNIVIIKVLSDNYLLHQLVELKPAFYIHQRAEPHSRRPPTTSHQQPGACSCCLLPAMATLFCEHVAHYWLANGGAKVVLCTSKVRKRDIRTNVRDGVTAGQLVLVAGWLTIFVAVA
jgi:hypothetical protein